jgi:hypothetical protein
MLRTHDGSHGPDCFGCRIQTVNFDPSAMPTRRNTNPGFEADNAWERGKAHLDGWPVLGTDLEPLPLAEWAEQRTTFTKALTAERAQPSEHAPNP